MKMINYSLNVENSVKKRHYLSSLWMNIHGKKMVYQALLFGIQSLFVSIQFEIDSLSQLPKNTRYVNKNDWDILFITVH